ncbi:MAG: sigma-70 family RNA polymerase sigma factor [Candidatus Eremiobacteraeota bacterium]|nr:sigma-70 family RNA polymerase sigma factor [Candidatus Eremiobacteraeota bacterium]
MGVTLCMDATSLRRDSLVAEYWYLCRRAARRFLRRGLDRGDLEQIGAIGLLKAIDRYDSSESTPFAAYAWIMVLGELMHYVRDGERLVRVPRSVRELERRWTAAERALWTGLGHRPTDDEIARDIGATTNQVKEVRAFRASGHVISFEALKDGDRRISSYGMDDVLDRLTIERILSALSPLERRIMRAIYLDGISVAEVAARLGYSRRHVTRLHRAALQRLKHECRPPPL